MAASPSVLGKVLEVFERNFRDRGELGASISMWWDGTELISEGHGWCERERLRRWTETTLVPVYSATKVPAAASLLLALEGKGLSAETPVREVWPGFPVEAARFSHLLSHQCGLAALDQKAGVFEHAEVVAAIEAQVPAWKLGEGHGYHPRTFGALVDEPVRRLTGQTLGQFWREKIAAPLGLDFWIGLPESEWSRVARLYPGKAGKDDLADGFYKQLTTSGTFTRRAFSSPRGLHAIHEMNEPAAWSAGLPALGGVGTASALAKFYQAAIGSITSPLSPGVRHALATPVSAGDDRVLLRPTVFTCGAQQDPVDAAGRKLRQLYGPSLSAFGHPGAGGSHGLGDPQTGISFAYVMNQMDLSVMPGLKCLDMVEALFSES
ncbi:MAG: serine hydrolase domain-containing protein [Verrucomicrobiota bacterium]